MAISEKTKKTLEKYGWSPERKIGITEMTKSYEKEGYVVFDTAREFFKSFGGLHLMMPSPSGGRLEKLHFDALDMSINYEFDWAEAKGYEKRVGEKLIPVGEAYNGYWVLMISESGKMYGAYCEDLRLEGNTCEEAIENLYNCVKTLEIP